MFRGHGFRDDGVIGAGAIATEFDWNAISDVGQVELSGWTATGDIGHRKIVLAIRQSANLVAATLVVDDPLIRLKPVRYP